MTITTFVAFIVDKEMYFIQAYLAMFSYIHKREIVEHTNLAQLKAHTNTLDKIFYKKSYNKYTYGSRKIKKSLPDINMYLNIRVNCDQLPAQFRNFLRCYYYQPYPRIHLASPKEICSTHKLFNFDEVPVYYDADERVYTYRGKKYTYIGEIIN